MYTIEKVWDHKGLKCVVLMVNDAGHRSGYVGVPRDNPFFGLYYARPELGNIDVHGGLSYSSGNPFESYPIKMPTWESTWWFGYDCGHYGDGLDVEAMPEKVAAIHRQYHSDEPYPIRDLEYCIKECESLADQLVSISNKPVEGGVK